MKQAMDIATTSVTNADRMPSSVPGLDKVALKAFESLAQADNIIHKLMKRTFNHIYSTNLDKLLARFAATTALIPVRELVKATDVQSDKGEEADVNIALKGHDWGRSEEPVSGVT
jgi:hypothetical protein